MTKELDKTELVRLAWITELRRQGHRQCTETYTEDGGLVCALGLLREIALADWSDIDRECVDDVADVGALAGLSSNQSTEVTLRNDGEYNHFTGDEYHEHTFAEIADVVEAWFQ